MQCQKESKLKYVFPNQKVRARIKISLWRAQDQSFQKNEIVYVPRALSTRFESIMCTVVHEPFSQPPKYSACVPNYAFQNQKKKQTRALQPRHAQNFYEPFVVLCAPRSLCSFESQHVIDLHDAFQSKRTSNSVTQMKIKNAISNLNVNYFLKSPNQLLLPALLCSL